MADTCPMCGSRRGGLDDHIMDGPDCLRRQLAVALAEKEKAGAAALRFVQTHSTPLVLSDDESRAVVDTLLAAATQRAEKAEATVAAFHSATDALAHIDAIVATPEGASLLDASCAHAFNELCKLAMRAEKAEAACAATVAASVDFGSYAKVLMTANHVTPEYLDDPGGYREKFLRFEAVVTAPNPGQRLPDELEHLREACAEMRGQLEDVVSELDLSDTMIAKHGPLGTAPSVLVREVLDHKDRVEQMLRSGFVDASHPVPPAGTGDEHGRTEEPKT